MKQSAVERAYGWLRERILDGTLEGGTFVDEAMICEGAEVSRTPAREALNRLEGERFVTLVPRRGARVRELNLRDVQETFQARVMIEMFAVDEFCRSDRPIPPEMIEARDRMDELAAGESGLETRLAYQDANQDFHTALVSTLQNQSILDFFERLLRINRWSLINRTWVLSHPFIDADRNGHHSLVEALERRDAAAAHAILHEHIRVEPYADAIR